MATPIEPELLAAYKSSTTIDHYGKGSHSNLSIIFQSEQNLNQTIQYMEKRSKPNGQGCIVWKGHVGAYAPYGSVGLSFNKQRLITSAHRVALALHLGRPIENGMVVDHIHSCTSLCVTPEHLEEVTPSENSRRAAKNQTKIRACRGRHPSSSRQMTLNFSNKNDQTNVLERIQTLEQKHAPDECHTWEWQITSDGYGKSGGMLAHIVALLWKQGLDSRPVDANGRLLHVDHMCRNKSCVNWRHLRWATAKENAQQVRREGGICKRGHRVEGPILGPSSSCRACGRAVSQYNELTSGRRRKKQRIPDREKWIQEYSDRVYERLIAE